MQDIGDTALSELNKVIPSFVRRAHKDHRHHVAHKAYNEHRKAVEKKYSSHHVKENTKGVRVELLHSSSDIETSLAAALLFESSHSSYESVYEYAQKMTLDEKKALFEEVASMRTNRRHKSPRALEHISFTFSMCGDYGSYRDMHRHRMLTQERRPLSCNHGFYTPQPIKDAGFEDVYVKALTDAQKAYDVISQEFPVKSQYVVPMAYNIEWYFHGNLRSFQWITELRSQPQGHETYRHMAHLLANAITTEYPSLRPFFTFVDFSGQTMGRLAQEERKSAKKTK
jgi:thymidylate synthase ThyX